MKLLWRNVSISLARWGVFKPWHDTVRQPQGVQLSVTDGVSARLAQECHLQLWVSTEKKGGMVFLFKASPWNLKSSMSYHCLKGILAQGKLLFLVLVVSHTKKHLVWLAALYHWWFERGHRLVFQNYCVHCPNTLEQFWITKQSSRTDSLFKFQTFSKP